MTDYNESPETWCEKSWNKIDPDKDCVNCAHNGDCPKLIAFNRVFRYEYEQ